jgi:hypothetical protein
MSEKRKKYDRQFREGAVPIVHETGARDLLLIMLYQDDFDRMGLTKRHFPVEMRAESTKGLALTRNHVFPISPRRAHRSRRRTSRGSAYV